MQCLLPSTCSQNLFQARHCEVSMVREHREIDSSVCRLFSSTLTQERDGQWCSLHHANWEISICRAFPTPPPVLLCKTHVAPPSAQLYYSGKPLFPHPSSSFTYILHKEVRNTWDKIQNILIKFVLLPSALLPRLKLNIAKGSLLVGTNTNC